MSRLRRCTVCGAPIKKSDEKRKGPFCSERCRMVDLGRWLGEEYKIPGPPAGDQEIAEEARKRAARSEDEEE